jgi:heparinase II/III-like protein
LPGFNGRFQANELLMDIFNRAELRNFVRISGGQIHLLPMYGFQLAYLVIRRFLNQVQRRFAADVHRVKKQRPVWLDSRRLDLKTAEPTPLRFPRYVVQDPEDRTCVNPQSSFDHNRNDPECYLSRNRWGECLTASLDGKQSARTAVGIALDWLGKSLPKSDAAWEPYSSCERVVNLAVLLSARPECRTDIDEQSLRCFFEDSLLWIDDHLEYYGARYTNNHILNNARALVVAGAVLQCVPAVERGLILFAHMARELFQHNGFLRERSSHYQVIVCNWLLDTLHFARFAQVGNDAGIRALAELGALSERVTRATSVLFTYLGETNTHIGDISPDVHPILSLKRLHYLYPTSITILPDTPIGRRDDWVFLSKNEHALVACVAPHSYPVKYTTHGHSDLGGFVWLHKGIPILVDAGRSRYTNGPSSQFQSGPSGHNTVLINGLGALAESLLLNARWCPEPYSRATVNVEVDPHSGFALAHNGFGRIKGFGEHVRQVGIEHDGIVVHDRVEGVGTVILETLWHFPPQFSPAAGDKATVTGAGMRVTAISASGTGQEPDHQWQTYPFASAYGDEQSAPMLRLVWSASLPCSIRTVLSLAPCAA